MEGPFALLLFSAHSSVGGDIKGGEKGGGDTSPRFFLVFLFILFIAYLFQSSLSQHSNHTEYKGCCIVSASFLTTELLAQMQRNGHRCPSFSSFSSQEASVSRITTFAAKHSMQANKHDCSLGSHFATATTSPANFFLASLDTVFFFRQQMLVRCYRKVGVYTACRRCQQAVVCPALLESADSPFHLVDCKVSFSH